VTQIASPPKAALAEDLLRRYRDVRRASEHLCEPLVPEDYVVQSMPDVSPTKWHLAHTSWFFETFLLQPHASNYRLFNPHFAYLFNSYYVTVGDRHCRQNRGQLSRPTVAEVYDYRRYVDQQMERFFLDSAESKLRELLAVIELGLNHEQQHQELMLTDIKHVFWVNPLRPAYLPRQIESADASAMRWISFAGGLHDVGHDAPSFAFDNESPRHRVYLEPYQLSSRLVSNAEYLQFIEDGGYSRADLWLSDGIKIVQSESWQAPLYWIKQDNRWLHHTLSGLREVEPSDPACHVSYFEADAFARWAGARLPSEEEWEVASESVPLEGTFVESQTFHPSSPSPGTRGEGRGEGDLQLAQMFGDAWQWTRSAYLPYPGFRPAPGALGEYNGKFMCNQFVLRGGSVATPISHIRRTYRNFFFPDARWQFTGIRLAKDA
jgi:ergothioneine biosynthesis protein EgtB